MSRAYRLAVSTSVQEEIVVGDDIRATLPTLSILSPEEQAPLLLDALEKKGYTRDACGTSVSKTENGVVIQVDGGGGVTIRAEETATVEKSFKGEVQWDTDWDTRKATERKQEELKADLAAEKTKAQQAMTRKVEGVYQRERPALEEAAREAMDAALRKAAGRLGEIQTEEKGANGDITIKVKV